jgi:acyl dehydratase
VYHSGSEYKVFVDKYLPQVYAGASGDFNVIHLDDNFGRQVGLGGYILHGMATMALGVNYFMQDRAADSIKRYRARFTDVVKPMDTLTYSGTTEANIVNFVANNQAGKEVLSAGLVEFA